jgi:hypothetical protein
MFGGSAFVALEGTVGVTPGTDPDCWSLFVSKGDTGSTGAQGERGLMGLQGLQGETGATGAIGATGATGPAGPTGPGFLFRGVWDTATAYVANDVVLVGGSAFVARASSVGVTPGTDANCWSLFASKGDKGDKGETGAQGNTGGVGPQGPQGLPGPQGPTGASGTTGQNVFTAVTPAKTSLSVLSQLVNIGINPTVNVPGPNSVVTLTTDGAIQVNSLLGGATTVVNILLYLDNVTLIAGRQITAANGAFVGQTNWSFTTSIGGLAAGNHTFNMYAQLSTGVAATVGDPASIATRGALTVMVLNR